MHFWLEGSRIRVSAHVKMTRAAHDDAYAGLLHMHWHASANLASNTVQILPSTRPPILPSTRRPTCLLTVVWHCPLLQVMAQCLRSTVACCLCPHWMVATSSPVRDWATHAVASMRCRVSEECERCATMGAGKQGARATLQQFRLQ